MSDFAGKNVQTAAPSWSWEVMRASAHKQLTARNTLFLFVGLQIFFQMALLIPGIGPVRVVFRMATFGLSLLFLLLIKGKPRFLFLRPVALGVIGVVVLSMFHPYGNTIAARIISCGMYTAILGPLFWVSRLYVTPAVFRQLMLVMWLFYSVSSVVGVLQIHYPGSFQPNVSYSLTSTGADQGLKIKLADDKEVYRPMGLTDQPGGACISGLYAFLFGLGFLINDTSKRLRMLCVPTILIGLFCIYLSQARSVLVFAGVSGAMIPMLMMRHGNVRRSLTIGALLVAAFLGAFTWAVTIGGKQTEARVNTLFAESPEKVYHSNRGIFLVATIEQFMEYPLGAGLANWGVVGGTFGNHDRGLYAEIQMTGWLYDGGIILILLYYGLLLRACWYCYQLSKRESKLSGWAITTLAYNVGALAMTFNAPIFMSQAGMEFFLLNAALFGAACNTGLVEPSGRLAPIARRGLALRST